MSWTLALGGAVCWSFVVGVQFLTAAAVIRPWTREADASRVFALYVLGHAAWSLWLLTAGILLFAVPGLRLDVVLHTVLVPAVWTVVLVFAFCREVLRLDARHAARRAALHQALTCLAIVAYVAWAVQLWPRMLAL